ncbi:hypothetical protein NDU88_004944 [Pleurodeles waltl]|uniref:Uncharacterized protein n=1 Tax=Pleurodeles waltl TaxID=8319 RepID=A0AAV7RK75_PLEWA|nr:hypothetical protein NDU88_004944 [Pleurodeles waltl]
MGGKITPKTEGMLNNAPGQLMGSLHETISKKFTVLAKRERNSKDGEHPECSSKSHGKYTLELTIILKVKESKLAGPDLRPSGGYIELSAAGTVDGQEEGPNVPVSIDTDTDSKIDFCYSSEFDCEPKGFEIKDMGIPEEASRVSGLTMGILDPPGSQNV